MSEGISVEKLEEIHDILIEEILKGFKSGELTKQSTDARLLTTITDNLLGVIAILQVNKLMRGEL
jgi:hypothetical protein